MEQSDSDLLELAVKATGADYEVDPNTNEIEILSEIGGWSGIWNPLRDDGDALRLSVRLGINIWQYIKHQEVSCGVDHEDHPKSICQIPVGERHGYDACAATRRAIVRLAAEITKATGASQ